jgi:hypothetical protein
MPVDASIPLQAQPLKLESPVNQLAMVGEAMKIGEMQRGIQTQNKLRDLYSQGVDVSTPEGFKQLASVDPASAMKLRTDALQGRKLQAETGIKEFELKNNKINTAITRLANLHSPQEAAASIAEQVQSGDLPPERARQLLNELKTMPFQDFKTSQLTGILSAKDNLTLAETRRSHKVNEGIAGGHLTIAQQTLANANNPELQATIAAAKAGGTETGKAKAQAAIALPGAIATGEEAIRKVDELVGKAPVVNAEGKVVTPGTKPAAGFGQAVGLGIPGLKYIPGTSAADFNARLNEIQGGAFLQAFNTLKGGGSITEKEGEKATAAINRMSTAQSEKEFNIAAREYQDVLRTGIARAKAKAASGGAAPAGGEIDFNSLK